MTACERCWDSAYWAALAKGTSQVDEYHRFLDEHEEQHRRNVERELVAERREQR